MQWMMKFDGRPMMVAKNLSFRHTHASMYAHRLNHFLAEVCTCKLTSVEDSAPQSSLIGQCTF